MGSRVTSSNWAKPNDENDESAAKNTKFSDFTGSDKDGTSSVKLGDVLSGRLAAVDMDSVEAVREARERR